MLKIIKQNKKANILIKYEFVSFSIVNQATDSVLNHHPQQQQYILLHTCILLYCVNYIKDKNLIIKRALPSWNNQKLQRENEADFENFSLTFLNRINSPFIVSSSHKPTESIDTLY